MAGVRSRDSRPRPGGHYGNAILQHSGRIGTGRVGQRDVVRRRDRLPPAPSSFWAASRSAPIRCCQARSCCSNSASLLGATCLWPSSGFGFEPLVVQDLARGLSAGLELFGDAPFEFGQLGSFWVRSLEAVESRLPVGRMVGRSLGRFVLQPLGQCGPRFDERPFGHLAAGVGPGSHERFGFDPIDGQLGARSARNPISRAMGPESGSGAVGGVTGRRGTAVVVLLGGEQGRQRIVRQRRRGGGRLPAAGR